MNLLANIYFDLENYQKASYYLSKALKIDEDNAVYWRRYSEIKLKLSFLEEAVSGYNNCLRLGDNSPEIYLGLIDVLSFLGEYNYALKVIFEAQKIHKGFAEIEYRFAGLFFIMNKNKYAFSHLIKGMQIDYDYHIILKELYPTVYDNLEVKKLLSNYKKATE